MCESEDNLHGQIAAGEKRESGLQDQIDVLTAEAIKRDTSFTRRIVIYLAIIGTLTFASLFFDWSVQLP